MVNPEHLNTAGYLKLMVDIVGNHPEGDENKPEREAMILRLNDIPHDPSKLLSLCQSIDAAIRYIEPLRDIHEQHIKTLRLFYRLDQSKEAVLQLSRGENPGRRSLKEVATLISSRTHPNSTISPTTAKRLIYTSLCALQAYSLIHPIMGDFHHIPQHSPKEIAQNNQLISPAFLYVAIILRPNEVSSPQ